MATVTVSKNPAGHLVATPATVTISKGRNEEVEWRPNAPDLKFLCTFSGASPFAENIYGSGKPNSGPPRPDVRPGATVYQYSLSLWSGESVDPGVVIGP